MTTRIGIIAYDNCIASAVLGAVDVFAVANWEWQNDQAHDGPLFEVEVVSMDGRQVHGFKHGLPILPHRAVRREEALDLIIIPPWLGDMETVLRAGQDVIAWVQACHTQGTYVTGVCTGTFLMAEAGLLTGREATTHWLWSPPFRERYPDVMLKPEKILIDEGDVICAGGMTAYLDLCLYLVSKFGAADLASMCSKLLLVDSGRRSQTPYQVHSFQKNHADEEILHVQEWLEAHYMESVPVQVLARRARLGKRTFMRRFKQATGDSPREYVQRLRVESAKRMLESTQKTFSEITWHVGYKDVSSFHRLFKRRTGLSPGAYRSKFSLLLN